MLGIDFKAPPSQPDPFQQPTSQEDVALLAWANSFLKHRDLQAQNLHRDFADGVLMINILEIAFDEKVCKSYHTRPKQRFHKMDNVQQMLSFLQSKNLSLVNVDALSIVNGNVEQTRNLLWKVQRELANVYLIKPEANKMDVKEDMEDYYEEDEDEREQESTFDTLIQWVNGILKKVDGVDFVVNDLWESFKDGRVFAAIINSLSPGTIDASSLLPDHATDNLQLAFETAEQVLGIPSLVEPEFFTAAEEPQPIVVSNYLYMLISAHNAKLKEEEKQKELDAKYAAELEKREKERLRIEQEMDDRKGQVGDLQQEMSKLMEDYDQIIKSQDEKEGAIGQMQLIKDSLEQSLAELEKSLAEERQANTYLERSIRDQNEELQKLNKPNLQLKSELYKAHREYEVALFEAVKKLQKEIRDKAKITKIGTTRNLGIVGAEDLGLLAEEKKEKKFSPHKVIDWKTAAEYLEKRQVFSRWFIKTEPQARKSRISRKGNRDGERWIEFDHTQLTVYKQEWKDKTATIQLKFLEVPRIIRDDDSDPHTIELQPKPYAKKKQARHMFIQFRELVDESTVKEWKRELCERISIIDYVEGLHESIKYTGYANGCEQILNFIADPDAHELIIENDIPDDLYTALVHFREPLALRRGLKLTLKNLAIKDQTAEAIADIIRLSSSIEVLNLARNLITEEGAGYLEAALMENTSLTLLNMNNNIIKDSGLFSLSRAFSRHPSLRKVAFRKNQISNLGIQAFVAALTKNPLNLVSLSFAENTIGDEGCRALIELCINIQTICRLDLSGNHITDTGAIAIAAALKSTALTAISLSLNQIGSKGATALASALSDMDRQIVLDLSHNKLIGGRGFEAFFRMENPKSCDQFRIHLHCDQMLPSME